MVLVRRWGFVAGCLVTYPKLTLLSLYVYCRLESGRRELENTY